MSDKLYTNQRSQLLLVALLKKYGIRRVIASPGTTNLSFVASMQHDPWFEMFSSVDERSAAYMACGMAAASGEPVVITCTGATASRNYLPAMTEAYYRKLPVLAVTATQDESRVGHLVAQIIDRSQQPADTYVCSESVPALAEGADPWAVTIALNRALQALSANGGGPVHLNMATNYSKVYDVAQLPDAVKIDRFDACQQWPAMPEGRVGIWVGNHEPFSDRLAEAVDAFCERYGAVVYCDHTSNYHGPHRVFAGVVATQKQYDAPWWANDVLIHIGEVSPDYCVPAKVGATKAVWRVNPDGRMSDMFKKLRAVFAVGEADFFSRYAALPGQPRQGCQRAAEAAREEADFQGRIGELPFSNPWVAQVTAPKLPAGAEAHFGILNSIRSWNFFDIDPRVRCFCNSGGFGIDGDMSACLGSAIVKSDTPHFLFLGDLAFFYDMNCLGNRHLPANLRIVLVNNGRGTEFRNYFHPGADFGDQADPYMAAAGHFGNCSPTLVRHYAEDLGFEYRAAHDKPEYLALLPALTDAAPRTKPLLIEVFTDYRDESDALRQIDFLATNPSALAKQLARKILPSGAIDTLKKIIRR